MNLSTRPTRVRWLIFALACAASWLLYLHRYAWGIVRPYFKADNPGLTDVDLGWLDSAFLATYAIGQIPAGIAGDRFGPRATLALFTLVWSLSVGGVGWSVGYWRAYLARAVLGISQAGAYPVISKITRVWFPLTVRTSVQGIVTAMGRVGGGCASILVATVLIGTFGFSWEWALSILTVPGVVLALLLWLILRNQPREHPLVNEAEARLIREGEAPAEPSASSARQEPRPPEGAFREGEPPFRPAEDVLPFRRTSAAYFSLAMMFAYIFLSTFQDQFYVNWIGSFLKDGRHLDDKTMGLFAPLPVLGGAVGGILGGFLNDWLIRLTGNRRWSRSGVAFAGKFTAGLIVLVSIQFEDGRTTMLVLMAARVFSDWSLPTQWAAVTDMGGRAAATLFGVVNTVGIVGGFFAGPIFGVLREHFGWHGVFYGVAGLCAAAATTWLFLDCTQRLVED